MSQGIEIHGLHYRAGKTFEIKELDGLAARRAPASSTRT